MKKTHLFIFSAVIFLSVCADEAFCGTVSLKRAADEAYVDSVTKITFPANVDAFTKIYAKCNLNPVYGTSVRYESETGAYADVYIYSLDTAATPVTMEQMRTHNKEITSEILSSYRKADPDAKITSQHVGREGVYDAAFTAKENGEDVRSLLTVLGCRGKIVKIRISYPASQTEDKYSAKIFRDAIVSSALKQGAAGAVESNIKEKK